MVIVDRKEPLVQLVYPALKVRPADKAQLVLAATRAYQAFLDNQAKLTPSLI